ncbi:MAG: signal peptidase I [Solirubrobacterales bacterium]
MNAVLHSSPARRLRLAAIWLFLGALFTALLAAAGPLAIGDHSFTLRSGSMTPTLETGDVVVTEPVAPLSVRVGQIVTFRDPEGSGRLYSHRVQSVRAAGENVHFVTRGDANTGTERWSVPVDGTLGRVIYRVPKLGYALVWTTTPEGRIGLVAIPALLLLWAALARIWRRSPQSGPLGAGEVPGGGS